jgi:HEAT repeat protein
MKHQATIGLLETALADQDPSIVEAALSLLGSSDNPAALDVMIRALKSRRHRAGLVAVYLEGSPVRALERLLPLLQDADPVLRAWAARLLGEYPGVLGLEEALLPLATDADPRVRKAAIAALGRIGDDAAARVALRLVADPVPFVRAHAARALGDLERSEHAAAVAVLLADGDWWVRTAAKQALEAMGPDVWTALLPCLSHPDKFVRNGAAEVIQNVGILDSLVVMEAASDSPSPAKIDLLRRIAEAGGARLTESLVERAGPVTGPKVRRLLTTMGLEQVGAA